MTTDDPTETSATLAPAVTANTRRRCPSLKLLSRRRIRSPPVARTSSHPWTLPSRYQLSVRAVNTTFGIASCLFVDSYRKARNQLHDFLASSCSIICLKLSYVCAPLRRRPLTKKVGVELTLSDVASAWSAF